MKANLGYCSRQSSPMQSCVFALLSTALIAPVGCDDDLGVEVRDESRLGAPQFRVGIHSTGRGSRRLNTARLGNYSAADAKRNGDTHVDETTGLRMRLRGIDLANGGYYDFHDHLLTAENGWLGIEGNELSYKDIIGAKLHYIIEHQVLGEFAMEANITGFAIFANDAGEIPLYNIEWNEQQFLELVSHPDFVGEGGTSDKYPSFCETAIDADAWNIKPFDDFPVANNKFVLSTAMTLYEDITLDIQNTGKLMHADKHLHMACVSAATGKGGLWGFPSWVSADTTLGLSGPDQLQAAMNVIRADYDNNGYSHTQDGTPLQIVNRWVSDFDNAYAPTESVWDEHGNAVCLSHTRIRDSYSGNIPECNSYHESLIASGKAFAWTKLETWEPLGTQDCTKTSSAPGCRDLGIEACVCDGDPYCCNVRWDSLCVGEVSSWSCNQQAACTSHNPAVPGCGHDAVQECVCDADPYCCNVNWDGLCVQEVETLGCGTCP